MNRPQIEYFPTTEKKLYRDLVDGETFTDPDVDGTLRPLFDVDGNMLMYWAIQLDGRVRQYEGGSQVEVPHNLESKRLGGCEAWDVVQGFAEDGEEYLLYRELESGKLAKLSLRTGAPTLANIGATVTIVGRMKSDG